MDYIISIIPQMLMGTVDTLRLFFITIVLAIPLGILLAFCRVSSFKLLRDVVAAYVYVLRGTPCISACLLSRSSASAWMIFRQRCWPLF